MWRCLGLLFGLCVIGLALGNASFAATEKVDKDVPNNVHNKDSIDSKIKDAMEKWGNIQHISNQEKIDNYQKRHEAELDTLSERLENKINTLNIQSELVHKNSSIASSNSSAIINYLSYFATVFAVIIAIFGIFGAWRVLTLGSEARKSIREVKDLIQRVEVEARESIKEARLSVKDAREAIKEVKEDAESRIKKIMDSAETELLRLKGMGNVVSKPSDDKGEISKEATEAAEDILNTQDSLIYIRALAIESTNDEKWQSALELWERVLEKEPKDLSALLYAALCIYDILSEKKALANDPLWSKANEYYERAKKIDDKSTKLWNNWGNLLQVQGDLTNADECFKKATDINPQYATAWNNWGFLLEGQAAHANGKEKERLLEQASEYHKKALELDPSLDDDKN